MQLWKHTKKAWDLVSHASTAYGLLPPTALTVLAMIAGALQEVPIMWIMVGGVVMLAQSATLLVRTAEWQRLRSPADKLGFHSLRIGRKADEPELLLLGFQLSSTADFPIEIVIKQVATSIGGAFPPKRPYENTNFVIPPRGVGWFDDHFIRSAITPGEPLAGEIAFEVAYGARGKTPFKLAKKFKVFIGMNEAKEIIGANWHEDTPVISV